MKKDGRAGRKCPNRKTQCKTQLELGYKQCRKCGYYKDLEHFTRLNRRSGNEFATLCKNCNNIDNRERKQEGKKKTISLYSDGKMCCSMCGCDDIRVLEIDHINGNGNKERYQAGYTYKWYSEIKRNKRDDLRVLCRNCNWIHLCEKREEQYAKDKEIADEQRRDV